jgi:hypothetical protein
MVVNLEQVLAHAKELMLKEGSHPPMVVVAARPKPLWIVVTEPWDDGGEGFGEGRVTKGLFLLGRDIAQREGVTDEKITAVYLVQEVWIVDREGYEPERDGPPMEQPDRRECLSVLEMVVKKGKRLAHSMYVVDVLRQGGVVDLGPAQKIEGLKTTLLASFLAGVGSARMSDQQLLRMMQGMHNLGGK